ncbi:TipC family immunity protein [Gemella sanguinis]|uniref:TipC family immunity protein n=1 Tax=Gemella sanguinis TaxID=84135 RepID=UPI0004E12A87|nr:TipC family immunity protein [Gemella sanguinis]NKZ26702.1 TipC family immunity protein [Gemella sanguinis]
MKKLNTYWVTLIVIVSIVAGYYTYHKVIIKNVFEEMYDSYYSFTVLGSIDDMPQIEPIPRDEKGAAVVFLNYKENKNENRIKISLGNYKDIQTLSILYSTLVSEEVYLDIIYVYDVNTHILKNYVSFYGDNVPETKDKISQTRELLQKYNISKEQLQKISDEGLDKVLTDWKNYSFSPYSKDNMGRLTIEKDEFLKQ